MILADVINTGFFFFDVTPSGNLTIKAVIKKVKWRKPWAAKYKEINSDE